MTSSNVHIATAREQLSATDLERLIVGRVNASSLNDRMIGITIERAGRDHPMANWHAGPYFQDGPHSAGLDTVVLGVVTDIQSMFDLSI